MYLDLISKYCPPKDQENCTHLGMVVAHAYKPRIYKVEAERSR